MVKEIETSIGKLVLTEESIAAVAGIAASECYGVVGMASRRLQDGLAGMLGRESLGRGVEVEFLEEGLVIRLDIIVGYGTRISAVGENVIEKVRYAVEEASGLKVKRVDVRVQGVRLPEER